MLVGGEGTRLRPLTLSTPKPMLPVAGVPLVVHQLARARAAGVARVVLATSYRAEVFATIGDGRSLDLAVEHVSEAVPLGTAGGIRNAARALRSGPDEPVLVFNGDVLSGHDIRAQLQRHAETGAAVTLHLTEVSDARAYGCVPVDAAGRVTAFLEKAPDPVTNLINAGCYIFRREVIDWIPTGRSVSVERETFPELLARGEVLSGFVDTSYWLDLGTPAAFVQGSRDLVLGRLRSPALETTPGPFLVAADAFVDVDAKLEGGSFVGTAARVGAGARVVGSVLFDGAVVGEGATVRESILGPGAVVGARSELTGAVLGERAQLGTDNELVAGARLWPGAVIGDRALRFSTGP